MKNIRRKCCLVWLVPNLSLLVMEGVTPQDFLRCFAHTLWWTLPLTLFFMLKRSDVSHCKHYSHCLYCDRLDTNHQTWRWKACGKPWSILEGKVNVTEVVTDASKTVMSMLGEFVCVCVCMRAYMCMCGCMCMCMHAWVCVLTYNNFFVYKLLLKQKLLAKGFPQLYHSLDVWHKSKKLKESLLEVQIACHSHTCTMSVCRCGIVIVGLQV